MTIAGSVSSAGPGTAIGAANSVSIYEGTAVPTISDEWLEMRAQESIRLLEPRYHPALRVDVPLARVMAGFARDESALSAFRKHLRRAQAELDAGPVVAIQTGRVRAAAANLVGLRLAVDATQGTAALPLSAWQERCDEILTAVEEMSAELSLSAHYDEAGKVQDALDECCSHLQEASEWLDGDVPGIWNNSLLVISGEAGRGKSHLLADTLTTALERNQPAVLLLGHTFLTAGEPWGQALAMLDWPGTSEEFLGALNERAKACGRRALLMVDALNEGEGRLIWPAHLTGFLERARRFDSVAVAVSVRTVAMDVCVPKPVRQRACLVSHEGFAGVEYDAVNAFFRHYSLVRPANPLLLPEFREPLFLDVYCRTAQLRPGLLARAAPSLTGVFGEYFGAMDQLVRARLDTDPFEPIVLKAGTALADAMHRAERRWLSRDEAKQVTQRVLPTEGGYSGSLFAALVSERILIEDLVVGPDSSRGLVPVVRFAYERLADHLIAQTLMDGARRPGGYDAAQLGRIVSSMGPGESTIDALALLLPEQAGLELTEVAEFASPQLRSTWQGRVIQSLLLRDHAAVTDQAMDLLEKALFGTDRNAARRAARVAIALACNPGHRLDYNWLNSTLTARPMYRRDMTWTAAITTGPRTRTNAFNELLRWVEAQDLQTLTRLSPEYALAAATTLMWAFPSSDRFLRDRATRRLIRLSAAHPDVLISLLQDAIEVDDLYVLERVCAVAYGVALRGLSDACLRRIGTVLLDLIFRHGEPPPHILLRDFARSAVRLAHQRGLVSDEQWDLAAGPWASPWPGRDVPSVVELEANYPLFAGDEPGRSGSQWAAIHLSAMNDGDFARYIVGTDHPDNFPFTRRPLRAQGEFASTASERAQPTVTSQPPNTIVQPVGTVPDTSPRHNQSAELAADDESHNSEGMSDRDNPFDTELVSRFVFTGVVQRGWTPERFRDIDKESDYAGRSAHKRERIGKKYQWQAWHEALARLADTYELRRDSQRQPVFTTSAEIPFVRDFDPSHLLTGNPDDPGDPFRDEQSTAWWLPLPEPSAPDLSTFHSQSSWACDQTGFLETEDLVVLPGHLVVGTVAGTTLAVPDSFDWVLLQGTVAWYWDPYGRTNGISSGLWADHGVVCRSVLLREQDVAKALETPPMRYQPHAYSQEFIDGPFLGEFPRQPAFADVLADRDDRAVWTADTGLNASVLLAADRYVWEGSTYDCSLHHTVSVTLPSAPLLDIVAPQARACDGAVYDLDGQVIAFAPDVYEPGGASLLIRADVLHSGLLSSGLALGRLVFQERRSGRSRQHDPYPGMTTRTSLHIHSPTSGGWTTAGSSHHNEIVQARPPRNTGDGEDQAGNGK
ncbi:hypothetical protein ACFORO_21480 [Amycolatopsis halotolerans]|uniref:ATP-binding protein n=1 Tax=Amycolatopsis halotolerans TaxID=330083 RepID=A0ABV7QLE7_9PSEU